MNQSINQNKKEIYIKCKKCGDEIYWNTHKKMTPCKCGAIEVDGCEDYLRVTGNKEDYEEIQS
jgi:Zn finger protein HypA/HybF involved in hydrogenase expression